MSPFNYFPLVWMFCSKRAHNLIRTTHHKALCARFNTFAHTLDELILKSDCTHIHIRNLQLMIIEIFKSLKYFNPEIMWDVFNVRESSYELRQGSALLIPRARSTKAINSFIFRATLAWNHLPHYLKEIKDLSKLKLSLKNLNKIYCQCKNCA